MFWEQRSDDRPLYYWEDIVKRQYCYVQTEVYKYNNIIHNMMLKYKLRHSNAIQKINTRTSKKEQKKEGEAKEHAVIQKNGKLF